MVELKGSLTLPVRQDNVQEWYIINTNPDPFVNFCTNGKLANYFLLMGLPVPPELTESLRVNRREYWLDSYPEQIKQKAEDWLKETKESIQLDKQFGDQIGLGRDKYWIDQDIWLLTEGVQKGMTGLAPELEQARALMEEINTLEGSVGNNICTTRLLRVIETTKRYKEITGDIVRKWIYNVTTPKGVAEVEVLYTGLQVAKPESERGSTVCVPISVGCPAGCEVCFIGENNISRLTAEQMQTILYKTIRGYSLPRLYPKNLKISWLGGGDPAFNMTEFCKAAKDVYKNYPESTQVVSTVGVSEESLNRLINLSIDVPTVSLQVSALSLDEKEREEMISLKRIISPKKIIELMDVYWQKTGKKPYLSLMMMESEGNSPEKLLKQLNDLGVDPKKWHITLDRPIAVRNNKYVPASKDSYQKALELLTSNGYEAHVYEAPELAFDEIGGCGVMSQETRDSLKNLV